MSNFQGLCPSAACPAEGAGNGLKSMHLSIASSLKNLQTDYVDIVRPGVAASH